ncbi:MAG: SDR family NAD(P)-dependent oxidoreductase [Flavobacteriaceae bacterium]|nr:SDR family NAD(P)-dependent oxidoreductase [Flavobacteriaceae bacterium]
MSKPTISILGCGWLGIPLAKDLLRAGFSIKGSTTSTQKLTMLAEIGMQGFQITLDETKIIGNIDSFLQSDLLIIDIPPKLRINQSESFVKKIELLIPFIEKSTIKNVLFVSSTSVFGDHQDRVDENSFPEPDSESGRQLLESEKLLKQSTHFKTTILRFGGLIGADRHPVYFLSGRKVVAPTAPVNLIHLDDCIGIVKHILLHRLWGNIFHGVSPYHPSKKLYYTGIARQLGLPILKFQEDSENKQHKTVDSINLKRASIYLFKQLNLGLNN